LLLMIPVTIVVGIIRYRLFEIDLVIRRSVVFGVLSLGIAPVYIGLSAAPGFALGNRIPVREVSRGGSVVDPLVVDALVARRTRTTDSPLSSLTPRELDVLREMAQGKTNAGIEQALHLSGSTVEKHVNSIFTKLGLDNEPIHRRVSAVLTFLRHM